MGYAAIAGHTDIIEILSQFAPSHYTIWANFVKILPSLFKNTIKNSCATNIPENTSSISK